MVICLGCFQRPRPAHPARPLAGDAEVQRSQPGSWVFGAATGNQVTLKAKVRYVRETSHR